MNTLCAIFWLECIWNGIRSHFEFKGDVVHDILLEDDFFLNLTTEAHCELSIVEYIQVATTKGTTSAPMQGDGSRNLGAFTCELVANWVTQNLNRGFSRSLCWDLTFTTSTNNQNISNPWMLKSMKNRQLSDRLYFTTGIC